MKYGCSSPDAGCRRHAGRGRGAQRQSVEPPGPHLNWRRQGYRDPTAENEHEPLPEPVLGRLFEPFYRGGVTAGNGAGLGLSLARKIAELHGGKPACVIAGTTSGLPPV